MSGNNRIPPAPAPAPAAKSPITLAAPDVPQADQAKDFKPAEAAAPSPEGLLAKAGHALADLVKPDAAEPTKLAGQPGNAAKVQDPMKEIDHNLPMTGDVQVAEGGIEVKAIGLGFIDNQRKAVNDVFRIRDMSVLGEWMEPTDKKVAEQARKDREEKREKAIKEAQEMSERRKLLLGL